MNWRRTSLAVSCLAALFFTGCLEGSSGPERKYGKITGTATHKGQPVKQGEVHYSSPETGGAAMAKITDGKFEANDLIVGKYTVAVTPPSPTGAPEPGKPATPVEAPDIPDKYRNPKTSNLTIEVKEGSQNHEIKLD